MTSPAKSWRRQRRLRSILGKTGKIITWTIIHVAGDGFEDAVPYPVVMVALSHGKKVYGQLVDYNADDIRVGKKVIVVLRKIRKGSESGVISYGIKVKPCI